MPDLQVRIEDTLVDGDRFAARLTYRGTHVAELLGAAPTGKVIEWDGLTIRRFGGDGRTVERWISNDTVALLTQIGLHPPS